MNETPKVVSKRDEENTPTVELVDLPLGNEHAQQTTGGDNNHGTHTAGTIGAVANTLKV